MRIKIYRKIEGCIKAVIIKREGERWFAIVQADQEPQPLPETEEAVGLDVGLASFVVDSEGNEIENPRCAEQSEDKLARLQRRLARAMRGSNNYKSLKDKIAKLHKRINCQRDDFLHKLSRMYVNNFDIICVEDLEVIGLKEKGYNKGMHRSIHDASWSKFIFMLSYKAQSAGRKLMKVDPRNTTQRCSADGTARCAHRAKTATSHISDASFGDEVGSRALQKAVVHLYSAAWIEASGTISDVNFHK
jgi:putative transposase